MSNIIDIRKYRKIQDNCSVSVSRDIIKVTKNDTTFFCSPAETISCGYCGYPAVLVEEGKLVSNGYTFSRAYACLNCDKETFIQ